MTITDARMGALTARINVIRGFHGIDYVVSCEVWDTPEGIVCRATENIFAREEHQITLLLEVDEDPELTDHEMEVAKNALWAVRTLPPAN